jgi:molecular chaperone GrpE
MTKWENQIMMPREPVEEKKDKSQAKTEAETKPEADFADIEDAETLKEFLVEMQAKAEANLAGWQRAQADFINYKRRSEQERAELAQLANSVLILSLLPVLDDFERAFGAIPPKLEKMDWVEGIKLVERKLWAGLEAQGLAPIEALGKPFDPNLHEAVRQDKGKEGIVIEEVQKGYKLNDRVIRPTMVVVGNGEEEA